MPAVFSLVFHTFVAIKHLEQEALNQYVLNEWRSRCFKWALKDKVTTDVSRR